MAKEHKKPRTGPAVTTLGRETEFYGKLTFTESLKIEGKFEGIIDSTGSLSIDSGADVTADLIKAASVVVGGTVHGRIEAADRVDMLSEARVYGDVRTSKLRIADGVIFEGRCEMLKSPGSYSPFPGREQGA